MSRSARRILFLILTLGLFLPSVAQENPKFRRYSIENGLSQLTVLSIIQDKRGFMWFATQDGLNRFDGNEFVVLRSRPGDPQSITNSYVTALAEDSEGNLWAGTDSGLNRYDPLTERFHRFLNDPSDPRSLVGDNITGLLATRHGEVWVGTSKGLDRFDPPSGSFIHYRNAPRDPVSLSQDSILALHEDAKGFIWVGTEGGGVDRLNPGSGHFDRFLPGMTVRAVVHDDDGSCWVGTDNGLAKLDPGSGRAEWFRNDPAQPGSLAFNEVHALLKDPRGGLWIGTRFGLDRLERKTLDFVHFKNDPREPNSLSENYVQSLARDSSGGLWVGTGGGLTRLDLVSSPFRILRDRSSTPYTSARNYIRAIVEDDQGNLWLGTQAGLHLSNRKKGIRVDFENDPRRTDSLSFNAVRALAVDHSGSIWVGTDGGGLNRLDPPRTSFTRFQHDPNDPGSLSWDNVRSLRVTRDGTLWVATLGGGLDRYAPATRSFRHYRHDPHDPSSLSEDRVYALYEDRSGSLWVGTWGGGLDRLDIATGRFEHFRHDPRDHFSLSDVNILSIMEDHRGTLWVGTRGGGLCRLDPENRARKRFTVYGQNEGLPNEMFYAILEDEAGFLWISHNRGLSRFDPRTAKTKTFTLSDGLQGLEFNGNSCFKSPSGEMFFGGVNGVNAFFPGQIRDNTDRPRIALTGLQIFGRPAPIGRDPEGRTVLSQSIVSAKTVFLSYKDKMITFSFAALHFASPENNQFAYRLEGFDKEWNWVGSRHTATYTNLPPGRFLFRVKASNNDGLWNDEGISVAVIVTPPFWKRLWFQLLAGLVVLGSVAGAIGNHTRNLHRQKRRLEVKVEERTTELKAINRKLEDEVAERQWAQQALQQEKLYLDLLIENAPEAIVVVDQEHRITRVNSEFTKMFGWQIEEVHNRNIDDVVSSPDLRAEAKDYTEQLDQGRNLWFESRRIRKDGSLIDIVGIGAPIQSQGQTLGYFAIYRDISDRKKAEEAFQREKAYLEQFIETAPEAIVLTENNGRILRINSEFEKMFGYTAKESIGRIIDDLVAYKSHQEEARAVTLTLSQGEKFSLETIRQRKDGSLFHASLIGSPIIINGQQVATYAIYRDISDRKKAEEALNRRATQADFINRVGQRISSQLQIAALLQEIVDAVSDTFHYFGVHLFLLDESHNRLRLQAVAGGYKNIIPDDLVVELGKGMIGNAASLGRSLVAPDVSRDPYFVRLADEFTRSELCVPIRSGGMTIGVLDIQSIALAAFDEADLAAMETLSSQLASAITNARLYEEAQAELTQRRRVERMLKGMTEDLARSNKELEQFAYVASHDLQEPMRMVGSYVQLLARRYKGQLDQDADDFIHFAVDGASRMQGMINDLLAYSRVGTRGKAFAPTDCEAALDKALTNLKIALAEKNAAITRDPLPTLAADDTQLTQLFQNLIGNAIKFQDKNTPRVHISAALKDGSWLFSVRDNGIGIETRYQERIFQIFERLHRDSEFRGTGIGLAICKRIVERHGGRIWVESQPGEGATFFFTIPNSAGPEEKGAKDDRQRHG